MKRIRGTITTQRISDTPNFEEVERIDRSQYLSKGFLWRDRKGQFHVPQEMETRQIFFTLRMI